MQRRIVITAIAAAFAAGTTLVIACQVGSAGSSRGLPAEGGNVDLSDLPDEVLAVGPHGCVLIDASGSPVTVRFADIAADDDSQIGKSDEVTPSTVRPGAGAAKEDCSIDVEKAAELVASGVAPRDAIDQSRIDPVRPLG